MSKEMPLLKLKNVSKFYFNKGLVATGFTRVSLEFNLGEFVVITGESGSGKSTLLNVLSGLDTYEEGEMYINGEETSHYNDSDFEHYRKVYIGNIFQSFNLVGSYTVYQNIELVLLLNGFKKREIHDKVIDLIKKVDLYQFRNTKVSKLSGGQKQRVAIARALAKDTPIIIADEPTGNLDSKSAKSIIKLLSEIAKDKLVIIVTHNYDQVESYATRKIEMNDGKVREDINLKEYQKSDVVLYDYNDIRTTSKISLGIRNSFNIFSKFILLFIVFLFIIVAFLGEYSVFKNLAEEEAKYGYNEYFSDVDTKRIVIKKKDATYFTEKDFNKINTLEDVSKLEKHDTLLDTAYHIESDEFFMWGMFQSVENITSVDVGRLPENDNEIVVKGYTYDYYLSDPDKSFNEKLYIKNTNGQLIDTNGPIKIVGIIYCDDYSEDAFYASEYIMEMLKLSTNENYSAITLKTNNDTFKVDKYSNYLKPVPNINLKQGEAIIAEDTAYICKDMMCKNSPINILVNNLYYEENINLNIVNMYNKNNFKTLTGLDNFNDYNGIIFISYDDYNALYNKYTYQSSVFTTRVDKVDEVANKLNDLGFVTLKMKDAIVSSSEGITEVINIFKIVVTVILFICLFFITYFVIKLIQKSKNVYYSIVRILGGSKKVIKNLISIELYTIYHLAFFIFMIFSTLVNKGFINVKFIKTITQNLTTREFIFIYLLLFAMSILLSSTYSRKLFKSSAMRTYREEV